MVDNGGSSSIDGAGVANVATPNNKSSLLRYDERALSFPPRSTPPRAATLINNDGVCVCCPSNDVNWIGRQIEASRANIDE